MKSLFNYHEFNRTLNWREHDLLPCKVHGLKISKNKTNNKKLHVYSAKIDHKRGFCPSWKLNAWTVIDDKQYSML